MNGSFTLYFLHLTGYHYFFSPRQEVPLLHVPAEVDGGTLTTKNVNNYQAQGYDGGLVDFGGAAGGGVGGGGGFGTSSWSADNRNLYNQYSQFGQFGQGDQVDVMAPAMMTGQEHSVSHYKGGVFDGMALSEHFLADYYDSVSISILIEAYQSIQKLEYGR